MIERGLTFCNMAHMWARDPPQHRTHKDARKKTKHIILQFMAEHVEKDSEPWKSDLQEQVSLNGDLKETLKCLT